MRIEIAGYLLSENNYSLAIGVIELIISFVLEMEIKLLYYINLCQIRNLFHHLEVVTKNLTKI